MYIINTIPEFVGGLAVVRGPVKLHEKKDIPWYFNNSFNEKINGIILNHSL